MLMNAPCAPSLRFPAKLVLLVLPSGLGLLWAMMKFMGPQKGLASFVTSVFMGSIILVSLAVLELGVRYVYQDVSTTADNYSYFAHRYWASNPPRKNKWGFRDRDFADEPTAGVYRIAVIGDSFTYGQGISEEERLTNILEKHLNNLQKRYEVINFGRSGAETVDEVKILKKTVLGISPDFILLQWFINDVNSELTKSPPSRALFPNRLSSFLRCNFALYYLVNKGWQSFLTKTGFSPSWIDSTIKYFSDEQSLASQEAQNALEEFFQEARKHNVPVGLVLFPGLTDEIKTPVDYPFKFLMDRVLRTCIRYDAPCVDLTPVFSPVEPKNQLWANRLDEHPSRLANELAAEAVLKGMGDRWVNVEGANGEVKRGS